MARGLTTNFQNREGKVKRRSKDVLSCRFWCVLVVAAGTSTRVNSCIEHTNFFENRSTEYSKASTRGTWEEAFG